MKSISKATIPQKHKPIPSFWITHALYNVLLRAPYVTKHVRGWLVGLVGLILSGVVSVLLGLNTATTPPLIIFISHHPVGSSIIGAVFVVATICSLPIWPLVEHDSGTRKKNKYRLQWAFSTALPLTGYTCFTLLLLLILLRPSWCPDTICSAPQFIPITNQRGSHDRNLEVYFTAMQTSSYVLSQNITHYSFVNLPKVDQPETLAAQRIDQQALSHYRVVLSVHSLQNGRFGMYIERVDLVVKQLLIGPVPLNIWMQGYTRDYQNNLYQALYKGQPEGFVLRARPVPLSNIVQLAPGETDTLGLDVASTITADLRFQVQITYRVLNESALQMLTLPTLFEVVFSDASNWHPYLFDGRRLIPSP